MIDDPEEEAWIEMEKRQIEKLPRPVRVKSFEDAFNDYLDNPGAPRTASDEEVRRHFQAGWVAAIRNEWAKERND
jgi:hypothetical protein